MVRVSIFLAILLSLFSSSFSYASQHSEKVMTGEKRRACHAKIDPKNLTGPSFKSEWGKCMANPDNYT
jgi:hypothetical protein